MTDTASPTRAASASPLSLVPGFTATARKLQLHLVLAEGASLDALAAALAAHEGFADPADPARTFRLALLDGEAHRAAGGAVPDGFALDAVVELGVGVEDGDDALLERAGQLGADVAELADLDASLAVLGDEVVIREGNGEFHGFRAIRRWPGLSGDQFVHHLLHVHANFGRIQPGRPGYRQLIVDRPASERAAAAAGVGLSDVDAVAQIIQTRALTFDPPPLQATLIETTLADGALIADRPRCFGGAQIHVVASSPAVSG